MGRPQVWEGCKEESSKASSWPKIILTVHVVLRSDINGKSDQKLILTAQVVTELSSWDS